MDNELETDGTLENPHRIDTAGEIAEWLNHWLTYESGITALTPDTKLLTIRDEIVKSCGGEPDNAAILDPDETLAVLTAWRDENNGTLACGCAKSEPHGNDPDGRYCDDCLRMEDTEWAEDE